MLSYDQLPLGYYFDDDGNANTDDVLIAHQLLDGSWVQNRSINGAGTVGTIAFGNHGTAYLTLNDLILALLATGVQQCGTVADGTSCLAGTTGIDDLAKFNLSFYIDPTGYTDPQFTLRLAASTVPEPGSLALIMLALGTLGVTIPRRKRS